MDDEWRHFHGPTESERTIILPPVALRERKEHLKSENTQRVAYDANQSRRSFFHVLLWMRQK